jgi:hypothetical protein
MTSTIPLCSSPSSSSTLASATSTPSAPFNDTSSVPLLASQILTTPFSPAVQQTSRSPFAAAPPSSDSSPPSTSFWLSTPTDSRLSRAVIVLTSCTSTAFPLPFAFFPPGAPVVPSLSQPFSSPPQRSQTSTTLSLPPLTNHLPSSPTPSPRTTETWPSSTALGFPPAFESLRSNTRTLVSPLPVMSSMRWPLAGPERGMLKAREETGPPWERKR